MTRDKLLFTPGPLTTSETVKQAMLHDLGSRDARFIQLVGQIRQRLLQLGGVDDGTYEAVLMQGSGTFAVESVIASVVPRGGKLLVVINGAYGRRMAQIARTLAIETETILWPEAQPIDPGQIEKVLVRDPTITHVGTIHCETTTGILNPVQEVGKVVRGLQRTFVVDAMSSFGGVPTEIRGSGIDFLISSANKCIQGVPGFGFVLARRTVLEQAEGHARSVSLDLVSQWKGMESNGQFRFTPPTHVLLAFWQALQELEAEGGIAARAARYAENHRVLIAGMKELGFEPHLAPQLQSHIITSFRYLEHPNFNFTDFYQRLSDKGFVIYPGKLADSDCFRIGTIGHIFPRDVQALLVATRRSLEEMGICPPKAASRS
ncbi:MAG TPA: 2-aminoethylphosphonate--pyruvate transaminase [Candidatus Acidoferrum sp.]|nr:2-aminoethylphosphonate--pyruvate transaminase [Candidatus Acidoferrum sp.]